MEIQSYLNHKNELYSAFIELIDDDSNNVDKKFEQLMNQIELQQLDQNQDEMTEFIRLLNKVSKNHIREKSLFPKIEKILSYLQVAIKQTLSNYELFEKFENNKPIILFLFQSKIVEIDENIKKNLQTNYENSQFFSIELNEKSVFEKEGRENFEKKRQIGENDSYICELIRDDSIEKFIIYINEINLPLLSEIQSSIFETNRFLIDRKKTTLIEYAAFFGSIQIFNYLYMNDVPLSSSLWLYAIHGRNAEIINILIENKIEPPDNSYEKCLEEAVKCHHNEIANYIRDTFINEESKNENETVFNESIIANGYRYSNYEYIPNNLDSKFTFFYLCAYGYTTLVKYFMKTKKFDINERIVFILFNEVNINVLLTKFLIF